MSDKKSPFEVLFDNLAEVFAIGSTPTPLERLVNFLQSRLFGTLVLIVMALLLRSLETSIPQNHLDLLLASLAALFGSYSLERSLYALTNQGDAIDETWFNSRRFGIVVLGFIATISNSIFGTRFSAHAIQAAILLFGFFGLFSLSLEDLGEAINPPKDSTQ